MTYIHTRCDVCGSLAIDYFGQCISDGRLRWSTSLRCVVDSSHAVEGDGWGLAPADLRASALAAHGTFELVVEQDSDRVGTTRTLQKALALTTPIAARLMKRMPGRVVSGTEAEMQWLCDALRGSNVAASSVPRTTFDAISIPDLAELVSPDWSGVYERGAAR